MSHLHPPPRPPAAHAEATDPTTLLAAARRIAVVGLSSRPHRPSHGVARRLLELGFEILPVNPNESEVLGRRAAPSLLDVDGPVDVVDVFRRPEHAPGVAREAAQVGARLLWLQSGVVSPEARRIAGEAGMAYVEDRCLAVVAPRVLEGPP